MFGKIYNGEPNILENEKKLLFVPKERINGILNFGDENF